jgi:hypothetical protein
MGNLDGIYVDPTLDAVCKAVEARAAAEPPRTYLGASSLGDSCERKQWYSINGAPCEPFTASTLFKFEDGHRTEALIIERFRLVPGVELWDRDDHTGGQIGGKLYGGRFGWHVDGVIKGLLQAPETPHVFEVKAVNPKKYKEFVDLRTKLGEKQVLMNWDFVYFVQAQVYMGLLDLKRHYLVVASPGGREMATCRTEFVPVHFEALMKKAERIIEAKEPPARVHHDPSYYLCKMCRFRKHCHDL